MYINNVNHEYIVQLIDQYDYSKTIFFYLSMNQTKITSSSSRLFSTDSTEIR
jgi:hypothetical protein